METNEEIIKLDQEIITLRDSARYERHGDILYCLNYAEPGMFGSSMGKIMPKHLAAKILERYKKEKDFDIKEKTKKELKLKRKNKEK